MQIIDEPKDTKQNYHILIHGNGKLLCTQLNTFNNLRLTFGKIKHPRLVSINKHMQIQDMESLFSSVCES